MNESPAEMKVFAAGQMACIKIKGKANCPTSVQFRNLVRELLESHCSLLVLELSECSIMDSTFLGGLAEMAMNISSSKDCAPVKLLNPNERVYVSIENLGVIQYFNVINGPGACIPEAATECQTVEMSEVSRLEMSENSLAAHKFLSQLSGANAEKFKDVIKFLEDYIHKKKETETASVPPHS